MNTDKAKSNILHKMGEEKKGAGRSSQTAIFVLLILIIAGSALFHSSQNTGLLYDSVESLTMELSEILTEHYLMSSADKKGRMPEDWKVSKDILPEDCAEWVLDTEGNILQQSGQILFIPEDVKNTLSETKLSDRAQVIWSGRRIPFLFSQDCFVIRPLTGSNLYLLTKNQAVTIKATQREQFALAMSVTIILVILTLVLINNMVTRFRRQIMLMATTDELTGLSNRKSFRQQYDDYILDSQRAPSSLFLLDVDHFKNINDKLGHAAGDKALSQLAAQIQEIIDEYGGFAGRWGGDEFIGVLPLPVDQACKALEILCHRVVRSEKDRGFPMTISIGATTVTEHTDLAKISEKADEALYSAKENGRNQVIVISEEKTRRQSNTLVSETITIDSLSASDSGTGSIICTKIRQDDSPPRTETPDSDTQFKGLNARILRKKLAAGIVLGVRWMTPFIAGGGILIALAFLFDAASVDLSQLPLEQRANFGSLTAPAAALKELGGITFNFMLPVFAAFMAFGLAGENAFMAGFVGGFMTIESNTGFAGAMISGLTAGLITSQLNLFTRHLPKIIRKIAPIVVFPILNLLILQTLTGYVITPLSGIIGRLFTAILDRAVEIGPSLGGGVAAMMMSADMGGVINKIAYQYGLDAIAANHTGVMAAVMIGGMVPPIGIALSMLLFPRKYSLRERESTSITMVMGLSFITEGALPFVFTDFVRVIPSCMAGSFAAGMLSSLYGCQLPAPHGGIFVIPVIDHPFLYIIALACGSFLTALLLGMLKKERKDPV